MKARARQVIIIVQKGNCNAASIGHSTATVTHGGGRELAMKILDRIMCNQTMCDTCKIQAAREIMAAIAEDGR